MARATRPLLLAAIGLMWMVAPNAHAASAWLAPTSVSAAGKDAYQGALAMSRDGGVVAVWQRDDVLEAVFRSAGGTFGPPQAITSGGTPAAPSLAFDAQGGVMLIWSQGVGARRIYASYRPSGGSFGPQTMISAASAPEAQDPHLAMDSFGNAVAVWDAGAGMGFATRPAGGSFGAPGSIGTGLSGNGGIDLTMDAQGNAILVAVRYDIAPGATSYVESSYRPAGGSFEPLTEVASAAVARPPSVAVDGSGNAIAVYLLQDPAVTDPQVNRARVYTAFRPVGGSFGSSQPLASTSRFSIGPEVAFDGAGTAVAVWTQGFQPQGAIRPAGGSFGPQQRLSPALLLDTFRGPSLTIDAQGTAHVLWSGGPPDATAARGVLRPINGQFSEMQTLSTVGKSLADQPFVSSDGAGNAVGMWQRTDGSNRLFEVAGFDGAAPKLGSLSVPGTGVVGRPLTFAAAAVDVWSPFTATWTFGDGSTARGETVAHSFATAGSFGTSVSATDALGNTASSAPYTVAVSAAPLTKPELSGLRLSRTRFRAAARGGALAATAVGTRVTFKIDQAATVTVGAQRVTAGRRSGKTCVKQNAKNRRAARCTRYITVSGTASRAGTAGTNSFTFRGRLADRRLGPGRYRLVLSAKAAEGTRSANRNAAFSIVRR